MQNKNNSLIVTLLIIVILILAYIAFAKPQSQTNPLPQQPVVQEEKKPVVIEEEEKPVFQRATAVTLNHSNMSGICGMPLPSSPPCYSNPQVTLNGSFQSNGSTTTTWFEYWTVQDKTNVKSTARIVQSSGSGTISEVIKIDAGFSYQYRIVTQNPAGKTYGETKTFSVAIG